MPEGAALTRRFDDPDERREFPLGRLDLVLAGRNRIEMDDGRVLEMGPATCSRSVRATTRWSSATRPT